MSKLHTSKLHMFALLNPNFLRNKEIKHVCAENVSWIEGTPAWDSCSLQLLYYFIDAKNPTVPNCTSSGPFKSLVSIKPETFGFITSFFN